MSKYKFNEKGYDEISEVLRQNGKGLTVVEDMTNLFDEITEVLRQNGKGLTVVEDMTNLLDEISEVLRQNGKALKDIEFISCDNRSIDLDKFLAFALRFDYDSGFGSECVNSSLMVVGNNWWLERHEYDGSEWFEFKVLPFEPVKMLDDEDEIKNTISIFG